MITKEKKAEYNKRYREKHPEAGREALKKWKLAHKEKMKQYAKTAYEKHVKNNPEAKAKRAAYHAKWQRENKEKWNAYMKEYRQRKGKTTNE